MKRNKPTTTLGLLAFLAMPSHTRISQASGFFGQVAFCHLGLFVFFGLSLSACSTSEKSVSGIEPIPEMRTRLITRWGQEVLTSTLETSTVPEPGSTTWAAVNPNKKSHDRPLVLRSAEKEFRLLCSSKWGVRLKMICVLLNEFLKLRSRGIPKKKLSLL